MLIYKAYMYTWFLTYKTFKWREGKVTVPEWLCRSLSRLLCFVVSINLQTMTLSVQRVMKSSMMAAEWSVNVWRRFGIESIRNRSVPAGKTNCKSLFTPSDYVTVTVTFDGQNGYATHFACHSAYQRSNVPPVNFTVTVTESLSVNEP